MIFKFIVGAIFSFMSLTSLEVSAALVGRLALTPAGTDYQAYYDTDANLTWLADASLGIGTGMGLNTAKSWAANLDVSGITGWRLPNADPACGGDYNCTSSEMGNLFYNVLANEAGSLTNTGPFTGVGSRTYWTGTPWSSGYGGWTFLMDEGRQTAASGYYSFGAWAVQSGDISSIPIPAAAWLFGSGLLALIGVSKSFTLPIFLSRQITRRITRPSTRTR